MLSSFWAGLRFRLLLLVLIAIVPMLGLTIYRNIELRQLVMADVKAESLRLARMAASDQQDLIKETQQFLFAVSQLAEVRNDDSAACSRLFTQLIRQYPYYTLLAAITPEGEIFCSASSFGGAKEVVAQIDLQQVAATHDFTISGYHDDPADGKATLNFAYPLLDETGQTQSILVAALDLTWLNQLAAEAQLPPGATFTVIDRFGTILARYPDPDAWIGQTMPEATVQELILNHGGEGTIEVVGFDGIPRLFAITPLYSAARSSEVYVSLGIPSAVAFADANLVLARNLIALGLVTVLTIAVAWFGSDIFVLRWVNGLVEATQRLRAGDLSARTGLTYTGGELSQLARTFDEMADTLERHIAERNRAEATLHETQRTLATLLSNLPGMAYRCLHNRRRSMTFVSEGCLELLGYPPDQFLANTISYGQLIHPDDSEMVWQEIETAVQRQTSFRLTYRLVSRTGEEKWVWEQGRGIFSDQGTLLALEGFITDVTERVLAYQQLEQRVAHRTRALSALYDVTAVASESLELEKVLERSLGRVLAVMNTPAGFIHLFDEARERLNLQAWQGLPANQIDQISTAPLGSGLIGWVIEQAKPVVIPDLAAGPQPLFSTANNMPTYLGVPMRVRGNIIGVLSVLAETGRQFDPEEVALFDSMADQIGVAVENARLYRQAEQLAVMNERSRLARDLHDSVTQSLYSATLLAEAGRRGAVAGDTDRAADYLGQVSEAMQQALKEMRLLVYELRPPALENEGLVGALQHRLDAVEGRAGVQTQLLLTGSPELPVSVEEGLYYIAQEALNNALKHAAATQVTIRLTSDDHEVTLVIEDNGIGFDPQSLSNHAGMGLVNMQERADKLGGTLTLDTATGRGTRVNLRLTLKIDPIETRRVFIQPHKLPEVGHGKTH